MNASDTTTSQRDELALLLQTHTLPLSNPLEISAWVAMSLLQKSLRRGEVGHALRAAATLLENAPSKLWQRLDGGLMRRRLQWPLGQQLRKMMEIEANGFGVTDATEALDLLRNDLPLLNEERSHVVL